MGCITAKLLEKRKLEGNLSLDIQGSGARGKDSSEEIQATAVPRDAGDDAGVQGVRGLLRGKCNLAES